MLIIVTVKRSRGAFVFLVLHRHVSSNVRLTLNSWILMPSVCFCSSSCFFTSSSRSFSFCHSDFSLNQKKKTIEFLIHTRGQTPEDFLCDSPEVFFIQEALLVANDRKLILVLLQHSGKCLGFILLVFQLLGHSTIIIEPQVTSSAPRQKNKRDVIFCCFPLTLLSLK